MTIALYTSLFGGEEKGFPLPQEMDVDAFCVSDGDAPEGWNLVPSSADERDPRLASREVKMLPWKFLDQYDYYLWVDGSVEILDPGYPQWVEEQRVRVVGGPAHPWRDCIYDEADEAEKYTKYRGAVKQADVYRLMGHPENWGLWATTSLVWRNTPLAHACAKSWWSAANAFSLSDQVGFPHVCKIHYVRPTTLPIDLLDNKWFKWHPHSS